MCTSSKAVVIGFKPSRLMALSILRDVEPDPDKKNWISSEIAAEFELYKEKILKENHEN